MSRRDADLEALIRSARTERSTNRWQAERTLFRRLGLGGEAALLAARVSYASGSLLRAPRLAFAGVGLVAAAALVGIAFSTTPDVVPAEHRERATPVVTAAPAPTAVERPAVPSEAPIPTMSIAALPAAPERAQVAPASASSAASARDEEDELAKETASVSRIRARLAARDFTSALAGVRAHRAAFRRGLLEQEVTVLEIEAHQGLGEDETACALGRGFLEAHPSSAHRVRVSKLVRSCNP